MKKGEISIVIYYPIENGVKLILKDMKPTE